MSYFVIQPKYIIPHFPSPCPPISSVPASLLINSWNVQLSNEVLPLKRRHSLPHQKAYPCRDDGFIFFSLLSNYSISVSSSQRCSKYSWERKQIASYNYLLCELWFFGKKKKKKLFLSRLAFLGVVKMQRRKYSHLSCYFSEFTAV